MTNTITFLALRGPPEGGNIKQVARIVVNILIPGISVSGSTRNKTRVGHGASRVRGLRGGHGRVHTEGMVPNL